MPRSEENIDDQKLYDAGMAAYRAHSEEVIRRVIRSRREDAGNFKYLEDEDFKRERAAMEKLRMFLFRTHLRLKHDGDREGQCGMKCAECPYIRYRFHCKDEPEHWNNEESEGWYCQEECECK